MKKYPKKLLLLFPKGKIKFIATNLKRSLALLKTMGVSACMEIFRTHSVRTGDVGRLKLEETTGSSHFVSQNVSPWSFINKFHLAVHLRRFLFIFLTLLVGVLLQILVLLSNKFGEVRALYNEKNSQYYYWTTVASQYPSIPDILYNAAVSSASLGKKDEALEYLNKALSIDPLFEKADELRGEILQM